MFTNIFKRRVGWLTLIVALMILTAVVLPQTILAGVVLIPIGTITAENADGDRLQVRVRGEGQSFNGMTGRARFTAGDTGEVTTVRIADSQIEPDSSLFVFFDADGNPVVEFDIAGDQGVEVVWESPDANDTKKFVAGENNTLLNFKLQGRSRLVP